MNKSLVATKVIFLTLIFILIVLQVYTSILSAPIAKNQGNSLEIYPQIRQSYRASIISSDKQILASSTSSYFVILDNLNISSDKVLISLQNLSSLINSSTDALSTNSFTGNFNKLTNNGTIRRNDIKVGEITSAQFKLVTGTTLNLDGIIFQENVKREYIDPISFSHILGFYNQSNESGLEKRYSVQLGDKKIKSLNLNINAKLQEELQVLYTKELSVKSKVIASIIISDVNSNRVISMLSFPSFDNSKILQDGNYFNNMNESVDKPLLNKAIAETYPTGSIMKIVTGLSLLESGAITKDTVFYSEGIYMLPGNIEFPEYYRTPYGNLDIVSALRRSSNIFFCKAIQKTDYSNFTKYQKLLNLGNYTGIDLPNEALGIIPSPEYKLSTFGEQWYVGDSCNAVIGQGYTALTSLQMVSALSTILTNNECEPRIANSIIYQDGSTEKIPQKCEKMNFKQENIDTLKLGMREVAKSYGLTGYDVAIKTGTAESGGIGSQAHAWVMGFYPYTNPKYAFIMMIEHGEKTSVVLDVLKEILNQKLLDNLD